jgi:signal transduction histidine kinase/DNA-binding response OmpR family regulator
MEKRNVIHQFLINDLKKSYNLMNFLFSTKKRSQSQKRLLLTIVLIAFSLTIQSQTKNKDSIKIFKWIKLSEKYNNESVYDSAIHYADKALQFSKERNHEKGIAHALLKKEEIYIDYDELDKAIPINEKTASLGKKLNDPFIIALSTLHKAQIKMYQNNLDEAIALFKECTKNYFDKHPSYYAALAYNDFGYTYGLNEDLINQTKCLIKSIKINESLPEINYGELAVVYNNLSLVYYQLKDNKKTIEYAKKSIFNREKNGNIDDLALGYCNMSQLYRAIDPKEAKKYQQLCVKFSEQSKNQDRIVQAYITSALIASDAEDRVLALTFEKKAVKILEEINNNPGSLALRYIAIGMHLEALKRDSNEAIEYYKKALTISETINNKSNISEVYKNLAKIYSLQNKYKEAFEAQKKYYIYRDSIVGEKTSISIAELETKYQNEKKEQEIKLLSAENKLAQKQKYIYVGLAALFLILGLSLFFGFRNKIKTAQKLKELNNLKSKFFANISHEFRTPLTLIKSPVQSLLSEIQDNNQKSKLLLIDKNSNRMLDLVDQLLELSKLDNGKLQLILKEGNITLFINSLLDSFTYQAKESKLTFSSTIDKNEQNHFFDKDVVEKIISNLLSNAIKYTPENEKITFNTKIENNQLQLLVTNSGSTIKKEELPKLFERFYQKKENHQGVGIGLALVKELVELYQGKIETTVENGILSFMVALPLENTNENAIVVTKEVPQPTFTEENNSEIELPILLLVDDNQDIRTVLKDIFKEHYQILEAKDGEQALKMAKKEIPDCIISDVMMPKMDGFEFTKAIKNNELTSFIPVILLTAKTSEEAHLQGLKSTADAYLTKPFNNEIIKEAVAQVIKERKKLQERYSQELILKPTEIVIDSFDEKFINKLQHILDKNITNSDFTAEEFANQANVSRMQLHRKLKSLFGVSTSEFIRNERIKMAAELLKKQSIGISEVGYAVGFNDISYFAKCFKETFKISPSEFHKNHLSD